MTDLPTRPTYLGVFLVALSTLVLEILLTKISSVVGLALTLALTRARLPTSIVYGVDLLGAACG